MRLLILGASARAAAFSALRAGYTPLAIDRYGDVDLAAQCVARRCEKYPSDLPLLARDFPSAAWMYTGAIENHAALVDKIGRLRDLYGNPGRILRAVRCPLLVADALQMEGLPCLNVSMSAPSIGRCRWVQKPLKSGGGTRVRFADEQTGPDEVGTSADPAGFYFQQYVRGTACSAVFVGTGHRSLLLGVTRQWVGEQWTGAAGFQYCGSVGPLAVREQTTEQIRRIGDCLARRFGLVGLFGVDAVLADGDVWVVEVNPRYTASVEVIERALGIEAISLHVRACRDGEAQVRCEADGKRCAGKAIVYADKHGLVTNAFGELARQLNDDPLWPTIADVPQIGTELHPRQPVTTVLAVGEDATEVESQLKQLVQAVRRKLGQR
jgi:predicted ATP-grasp superfamily ATP-dependent carboligase